MILRNRNLLDNSNKPVNHFFYILFSITLNLPFIILSISVGFPNTWRKKGESGEGEVSGKGLMFIIGKD